MARGDQLCSWQLYSMQSKRCHLCMQEDLEELAMLESLDNGKPLSASKGGDLPQVLTLADPYAFKGIPYVTLHSW